ncbi:hypothetical protein [Saccharopolyspora griseoalba]|uniref:Uncharacterized protein n=1 Tax=Saccharopolyspora griseoalba TaxID=1431848 RepID=A0ABW2LCR7_9PSEU
MPTEDRRAAADDVRERLGAASAEEILDLPSVLIGTPEEMTQQLLSQRERYGFTHYAVQGFFLEAFAPVISLIREQQR